MCGMHLHSVWRASKTRVGISKTLAGTSNAVLAFRWNKDAADDSFANNVGEDVMMLALSHFWGR